MAELALEEQEIFIDRSGRKMPLFIAAPEKPGKYPAVIVVHEIFGLNDHIRDVARRFARSGMVAYAPDLFERQPGMPADRNDLNAMRSIWAAIPDDELIADMQSVLDMAQLNDAVHSDKVGAIGYCMGGAIAYMFACRTESVAWIADYYGRIFYPELTNTKPKHPIDYTDTLKCPVLGLFSGIDELIPKDHVAALESRLEQGKIPHEIKIYDNAKHAFFNDRREFYDAQAAADAWNRTLQFINRHTHASVG